MDNNNNSTVNSNANCSINGSLCICANEIPDHIFTESGTLKNSALALFILQAFIVVPMSIFGLLGNTLALLTLTRHHSNASATNWMLRCLAIVDNIYLILILTIHPLNSVYMHTNWIEQPSWVVDRIMHYTYPIKGMAHLMTVWMMLIVTANRYSTVYRPLGRRVRYITRSLKIVLVAMAIAVLYSIPTFFEIHSKWYGEGTNIYKICWDWTELRKNRLYILLYKTIMDLLFRSAGPLIMIIVLWVQLKRALVLLYRRQALRRAPPSFKQDSITSILTGILTIFILCQLPETLVRIIYSVFSLNKLSFLEILTNHEQVTIFYRISDALLVLNSSVKVVIYCVKGKIFRQILLGLICPCWARRNTQEYLSHPEYMRSMSTDFGLHVVQVHRISTPNEGGERKVLERKTW